MPAARSPTSASRTGGPRTFPWPGPVELRRDPVRLLPRPRAGVRGLQGRPPRLLARNERQVLGHGASISSRQARPGQDGAATRSPASRRCRPSRSILRRTQFQDPRVRTPSIWPSTSSGPTRTCSTTSTQRVGSYFDNSELKAHRPAARPRARDPQRGQGRGARRGLHHGMEEPLNASPRTRAAPGRGRASCWPRQVGRPRTAC